MGGFYQKCDNCGLSFQSRHPQRSCNGCRAEYASMYGDKKLQRKIDKAKWFNLQLEHSRPTVGDGVTKDKRFKANRGVSMDKIVKCPYPGCEWTDTLRKLRTHRKEHGFL